MKAIKSENLTLGPFNSVYTANDRFVADGDEIPFSMLINPEIVDVEPISPAAQIPQEVTMRQARLALLANGLLSNVQIAINSLPEPDKTKAQIEWEYSNALQRMNPFVATLGAALGLDSAGIDNLFIQASTL